MDVVDVVEGEEVLGVRRRRRTAVEASAIRVLPIAGERERQQEEKGRHVGEGTYTLRSRAHTQEEDRPATETSETSG